MVQLNKEAVDKLSNIQSICAWALFRSIDENAKTLEEALNATLKSVEIYQENQKLIEVEGELNDEINAFISDEDKKYMSNFAQVKDAFLSKLVNNTVTLDDFKSFANDLDEVYKMRGAALKSNPALLEKYKEFFLLVENMRLGLKKEHFA